MPDDFDRDRLEKTLEGKLGRHWRERLPRWTAATMYMRREGELPQRFLTDEEEALTVLLMLQGLESIRLSIRADIARMRLPAADADKLAHRLERTAIRRATANAGRTARRLVRSTVADLEANKAAFKDDGGLIRPKLRELFGRSRQEGVAITETTASKSSGTILLRNILKADDLVEDLIVVTARDDHVCPVCERYEGKGEAVWGRKHPRGTPFHPRCRCDLVLRLRVKRP